VEQRLEFLRRDVALRHAAVVAARELLIEALGERMCGGGQGPAPAEVETFERRGRPRQRRGCSSSATLWLARRN
jgi:hypothetical protein